MRTGEIHAVLVRHQLLPYGVTGAGTQVLGLTDTAEVARALLALEARLREVERERDRQAEGRREMQRLYGEAARDGGDAHRRLASIESAAGDLVESVETWDCGESWEHEGDCIDNAEGSPDDCLRCHVLRTLRAAIGKEGGRG